MVTTARCHAIFAQDFIEGNKKPGALPLTGFACFRVNAAVGRGDLNDKCITARQNLSEIADKLERITRVTPTTERFKVAIKFCRRQLKIGK